MSLLCGVACALLALIVHGQRPPNIVLIVVDDVGWADVSYNSNDGKGSIPTPNIDKLSSRGIRFTHHYVQSTCTPSRASLMTGRYATNTGLVFAMLPGSVAGLPPQLPTIPQVLRRRANYSTHMVGKWHLGHAQWKQTPVGRGFQTHTGSYLWSMDYYTKELWSEPWNQFGVDWVEAHENGTYRHYVEERHSTIAFTDKAKQIIKQHNNENPLFLYLAYTAAHSPLVPHADDEKKCAHIPHLWRRQFCGLMVGLDKGIGELSATIPKYLGENTVLVFMSDNGGAPWFGGLNYPLRSGKTTPFEGGVRVPAFAVDFTTDSRYFGRQGREFHGLVHISDWLPTFAKLAGIELQVEPNKEERKPNSDIEIDNNNNDEYQYLSDVKKNTNLSIYWNNEYVQLDGLDLTHSLKTGATDSERGSMLLEMYFGTKGEFMFPENVVAYRRGKYKLIDQYRVRDANWYTESTLDALNTTDSSYIPVLAQSFIRALESFTTPGRFDTLKDVIVHLGVHKWYSSVAPEKTVRSTMLFDIEADPSEKQNIAWLHPQIVGRLRTDYYNIKAARPKQARFWLTIDRDTQWEATLKPGDCPTNWPQHECRFVHPWVDDSTDLNTLKLIDGTASYPFIRNIMVHLLYLLCKYVLPPLAVLALIIGAVKSFRR